MSTFSITPRINAVVRTLLLSPDKRTVYAGGDFGLLALNSNTGKVRFRVNVAKDNGPGRIFDLAIVGSSLYIGGEFNTIGKHAYHNIARLSLTGTPDTSWKPGVASGFSAGRSAPVQALAVSPSGQTVYIGGNFRTINDTSVSVTTLNKPISLLAVSALDGTVQPQRFSPDLTTFDVADKPLYVHDIVVTDSYVIVAWGGENFLSFHSPDGATLKQYSGAGDVQAVDPTLLRAFEDIIEHTHQFNHSMIRHFQRSMGNPLQVRRALS